MLFALFLSIRAWSQFAIIHLFVPLFTEPLSVCLHKDKGCMWCELLTLAIPSFSSTLLGPQTAIKTKYALNELIIQKSWSFIEIFFYPQWVIMVLLAHSVVRNLSGVLVNICIVFFGKFDVYIYIFIKFSLHFISRYSFPEPYSMSDQLLFFYKGISRASVIYINIFCLLKWNKML